MSKCYICDATLSPNEIEYEPDYKRWRPCNACLDKCEDTSFKSMENDFDFTMEEFQETLEILGIDD